MLKFTHFKVQANWIKIIIPLVPNCAMLTQVDHKNEESPLNSNLSTFLSDCLMIYRIKKSFGPNFEWYVFNNGSIPTENNTYKNKTIAVNIKMSIWIKVTPHFLGSRARGLLRFWLIVCPLDNIYPLCDKGRGIELWAGTLGWQLNWAT